MSWILTLLAVFIAFGYSMYVRAILKGDADLMEKSLMATIADWMVASGPKSRKRVWFTYWSSLVIELGYLYLALTTLDNMALNFITAAVLGIEAYNMSKLHQRLWWFFHGKITLGEVFVWKVERVSSMALFTHAILVLLFPLANWLA